MVLIFWANSEFIQPFIHSLIHSFISQLMYTEPVYCVVSIEKYLASYRPHGEWGREVG